MPDNSVAPPFQMSTRFTTFGVVRITMEAHMRHAAPWDYPRGILLLFAIAMFATACDGGGGLEKKGQLEVPELGTIIQWYSTDDVEDDARLRELAEKELTSLPADRRVEILVFGDAALAASFATDATQKEELLQGFFDPSIALATSGGAMLVRDPDSDPQWTYFAPPRHKK